MLVLCIYNAVDIITILAQCRPVSKIWDRRIEGSCWNPNVQDGFAYAQGGLSNPLLLRIESLTHTLKAISALSAFALSGFPILIIRDLQLDNRTKMALLFLLGLGVL